MSEQEERIRHLIETIEPKYLKFWQAIVAFKTAKYYDGFFDELVNFQYDLANCLFSIKEEFLKTTRDRKAFLKNSRNFSHIEVQTQKYDFDKCLHALKQLIYIGKSIGDAFVWFYYNHDRGMLNEHIKAQEQLLVPDKLGGFGELEFVKKVKMLNGYMVLYHGITNILRIGDVSLIDPKTFELAGLAEIKTKKKGKNEASISLHAFGYNSRGFGEKMGIKQDYILEHKESSTESDSHEERLKRQIEVMLTSLTQSDESQKSDRKNILTDSYTRHLEEVISENKTPGQISYRKADEGLLFLVWRPATTKLPDSLFTKLESSTIDKVDLAKAIMSITDATTRENSTIYGSIHYGSEGVNIYPGAKPIFWLPINDEALKQIYFKEVQIITIFNPLFLVKEMAKDGFVLEYVEECKKNCFVKQVGEGKLIFENFSHFFPLISNHLFQIKDVKTLINQYQSIMQEKNLSPRTKVAYQLFQE